MPASANDCSYRSRRKRRARYGCCRLRRSGGGELERRLSRAKGNKRSDKHSKQHAVWDGNASHCPILSSLSTEQIYKAVSPSIGFLITLHIFINAFLQLGGIQFGGSYRIDI